MIKTHAAFCLSAILLATAGAHAAPTLPTNCILFPDDCAGSALASRYATRGLADHPFAYNPATDPPEVQMFRATMDTALYPDAVCNDGSPAVLYFDPAPMGSDNADRWVIQLEGGGTCLEAEDSVGLHKDCMDRWTGRGPASLDFPRKMSTDLDRDGFTDVNFLPFEARIPGLLGANTVVTDPSKNGGGDAWNRVYINYCSSDGWRGQSGSMALFGGEWIDSAGNPHTYEPVDNAFFNGHLIVDSVLDALAAGIVSDDQERYIHRGPEPPKQIVLVGESAGGSGVMANLDFVASKAGWGTDGMGNPLDNTYGVSGASTHPEFAHDDTTVPWYTGPVTVQELDTSVTPPLLVDVDLDANGVTDTHEREADTALRRPVFELIDAFFDESCIAANTDPFAADPGMRHWLCYTSSSLLPAGHITSPILVKQDLNDTVIGGSTPAFGEGVRQLMAGLPANHFHFGPRCGHHDTLSHGQRFKRDRVIDAGGRQVSYHTAIAEFVNGAYVSIYFDPGVTTRACAP